MYTKVKSEKNAIRGLGYDKLRKIQLRGRKKSFFESFGLAQNRDDKGDE